MVEVSLEPVLNQTSFDTHGKWKASGNLASGDLASTDLHAGDTARLTVTLSDTAGGTPMSGAFPAAWMGPRPPGEASLECGERVATWLSGDLFSRAELDFNTYQLATLNDDATITVVDPLFGFGGTRLLALIELDAVGKDWVLMDEVGPGRLYVSQPDAGLIAVIRTDNWTLERQIPIGDGVGRLVAENGAQRLWAAYDQGIVAIDPESLSEIYRIPLPGVKEMVTDDDNTLFVTLPSNDAVVLIDTPSGKIRTQLQTGPSPATIAWSELSQAAWVGHNDGSIAAVDPGGEENGWIRQRITTKTPVSLIRFDPGGRLGFALSTEENRLHIIDSARGRLIKTGTMAGSPDQVEFSDHLAYITHRDDETVLMVPLNSAAQAGQPVQAADFPGGLQPAGRQHGTLAPGLMQAPGANAMVLANAADEAVYFYMEGMAAPMGHFRNYSRQPLAVQVVDRSLEEALPGQYETTTTLSGEGRWDLAVFLDSPRLVQCFTVDIKSARIAENTPPVLKVRLVPDAIKQLPGDQLELVIEVIDLKSGEKLSHINDLSLIAINPRHGYRLNGAATSMGQGKYLTRIPTHAQGTYQLHANSPSNPMLLGQPAFANLQIRHTEAV